MNSKELFLKNKALREQWAAVAHADWFAEVLTHARAAFMGEATTMDGLTGAMKFQDVLLELCDEEPAVKEYPKPGIDHNLDNPKPTVQPPPEQK